MHVQCNKIKKKTPKNNNFKTNAHDYYDVDIKAIKVI